MWSGLYMTIKWKGCLLLVIDDKSVLIFPINQVFNPSNMTKTNFSSKYQDAAWYNTQNVMRLKKYKEYKWKFKFNYYVKYTHPMEKISKERETFNSNK